VAVARRRRHCRAIEFAKRVRRNLAQGGGNAESTAALNCARPIGVPYTCAKLYSFCTVAPSETLHAEPQFQIGARTTAGIYFRRRRSRMVIRGTEQQRSARISAHDKLRYDSMLSCQRA